MVARIDPTYRMTAQVRTNAEAIRQAVTKLGHRPWDEPYAASGPRIAGFVLTMQNASRLRRLGGA